MQCLKQRFLQIHTADGLPSEEIETIEKRLAVRLPDDFRYVMSFFPAVLCLGALNYLRFLLRSRPT